jgi:hypothetical protein
MYRKSKHIFFVRNPFPENHVAYEKMEKCSRDEQATDGNIVRRMGFGAG